MIKVRNITKKYGNHTAVSNISFDIEKGKIYGLLGSNGAGKSTTMNIITGCLAPTGGSVTIDGLDVIDDPIRAKKKIGYLPEIPPLYEDMTPAEYLVFVAEAKGVEAEKCHIQVRDAMEITKLTHVSDRLIKNLSKGYRQRVGIAQALLGDPDIIILDEPTVGLDPRQITEIRALIRQLGEMKTVIVSSHILAEINEICDHVMIISGGQLVANDTLESLKASFNQETILNVTVKASLEITEKIMSSVGSVDEYTIASRPTETETSFSLKFNNKNDPREEIFFAFAKCNIPVTEMHADHLTLEDIFLSLTNESHNSNTVGDNKHDDDGDDEKNDTEDYTPLFSHDNSDIKKEESEGAKA